MVTLKDYVAFDNARWQKDRDSVEEEISRLETALAAARKQLQELDALKEQATSTAPLQLVPDASPGFRDVKKVLNKRTYTACSELQQVLPAARIEEFLIAMRSGGVEGVKMQDSNLPGDVRVKLTKDPYKQPSRRNKFLNAARKYLGKVGAVDSSRAVPRSEIYQAIRNDHPEWGEPHNTLGARFDEIMKNKLKTQVFVQEKRGNEVYVWRR